MSEARDAATLVDHEARERAVDRRRSCIVQAPAGSGKTTLLARRYVNLLTTVDYPEQILAITFTIKAAAEMRQRVLRLLTEDHPQSVAAMAHARERGWDLLRYPMRMRIQTIDAFAMHLTRALPVTSELHAASIDTEPQALYELAVQRVFARLQGGDSAQEQALTACLAHFGNNFSQLSGLLVSMLERRPSWFYPLIRELSPSLGTKQLTSQLAAAAKQIRDAATQQLRDALGASRAQALEPLAQYSIAQLTIKDPDKAPDPDDLWGHIAALLIKSDTTLTKLVGRKTVTASNGFPTGAAGAANKRDMLEMLAATAEETATLRAAYLRHRAPDPRRIAAEETLLEAFFYVLLDCVGELNALFQISGRIDFAQLTIAARNALGTEEAPTDLRLALDYRLRHLLVDEFQDTSRSQFELFADLLRGWSAADDNTFFAVGDPMQSIYRFRDAEVGMFIDTCENGISGLPLEHLRLETNFRSTPTLIRWFNGVFPHVLGSADAASVGAVSYSPAVARPTTPDPADGDDDGVISLGAERTRRAPLARHLQRFDTDAAHLEAIVATISRWRAEVPLERIAVLLTSRRLAGPIIAAFEAGGIPWQGIDLHALGTTPVVTDLLALTRALFDPRDAISLTALLRSPLVGLQLEDLKALASQRQSLAECLALTEPEAAAPAGMSATGAARWSHLRAVLLPWWPRRAALTPRELVEALWLRLGGSACYRAPDGSGDPNDERAAARFFSVLETGHPWQVELVRLEREIDKLYAQSTQPGVAILTIHKSKGLEYDRVIVANLEKTGKRDEAPLLRMQPGGSQDANAMIALKPALGTHKKQELGSLYDWLKQSDTVRGDNERRRLLYVAATRARDDLMLTTVLPAGQRAVSGSLLACLDAVPGVDWLDGKGGHGQGGTAELPPPPRLRRVALPLPAAVTHPNALPGQTRGNEASSANDTPGFIPQDRRRAILRGELIHAALCDLSQGREPPAPRYYEREGILIGLPQAAATELAAEVAAQTAKTLADPLGHWCVQESHDEAQAELALGAWGAFGPVELAIDRTFVYRGDRWIIDYKSAAPAVDDDEAEWIQGQINEYAPQLERYGRALRERTPVDGTLRAALFFTALGQLWEVDVETVSGIKLAAEQLLEA
ncbi:MAG: UvrD-helicase domain-containing protein [Pseudomonadota bacterium]